MSKTERGLPPGFGLKLPPAPVELGDYLDEAAPARVAPAAAAPAAAPVAPAAPVPVEAAAPEPTIEPVRRPLAIPRKQFNMSGETMRMLDELVAHIRRHSAERDVRASEVFHALVMAGHEVRSSLDLGRVAPRGRWGSATAAALPEALKEAFERAIVRKFA